jgi:hypothetical protein
MELANGGEPSRGRLFDLRLFRVLGPRMTF